MARVASRAARRREAVRRPSPADAVAARKIAAGALLVALTLAAYVPVLDAGFIWDDDDYVSANATLRSVDGLRRIWLEPGATPQYYPVTFTTFWLEYHLWGLAPLGYHLVNVVLHGVNAVLLWLILLRLRVPGAWFAAAVFALHPMQVESVAWVTERKNVLSGIFALGAALVWLAGEARDDRRRALAVAALFVAAILSKSVTCTLPAVLVLVAWWQRGTVDRRAVVRLVPLALVGAAMAAMTVWMERHHVGATGAAWALTPAERVLVAGRALWFYPRTLVWPRALTFMYPRWSIDVRAWWQWLFPAAALAVIAALWLARRRLGRGPLAAALLYAGTLAPALGFVNVFPMRYSFVADHFAYLAIIGLVVLAVAAAARWHTPAAVGVPVLVILAALSARRTLAYRDLHTLWTDTLAKNPDSWMAHNNLGGLLLKEHAYDDAIAHLGEALRLKPDNPQAENDLAVALDMQGKSAAAIPHYARAVTLDPGYANAHYNYAGALRALGRTDEAIAHYREAIRARPDLAEAHAGLGALLASVGRRNEAIAEFEATLRLRPDDVEARRQLARLR